MRPVSEILYSTLLSDRPPSANIFISTSVRRAIVDEFIPRLFTQSKEHVRALYPSQPFFFGGFEVCDLEHVKDDEIVDGNGRRITMSFASSHERVLFNARFGSDHLDELAALDQEDGLI